MRVDEKTKQVLKEWPLEQVRRYAAAAKTFTLGKRAKCNRSHSYFF